MDMKTTKEVFGEIKKNGFSLKNVFFPYFCGDVGAGCYRDIAKFLGGEMERVAETKNYDKFVFTFQ